MTTAREALLALADELDSTVARARQVAKSQGAAGDPESIETLMHAESVAVAALLAREHAERYAAESPWPLVKGRCPACGLASLFLGEGGYATCSILECTEPDAATTLLERDVRDGTS